MATLREIIYDIREVLNAYSDDSNISDEHLAFIVNNKRNLLLKQYMSDMRKEIPLEALQTICLSLDTDANCIENRITLKSNNKVPPTLENSGRSNITNIYGKNSRFLKFTSIIDYSRLPHVSEEQYNGSILYVSIDNKSYLNIYNTQDKHILLEEIEVEAPFENPEEAYKLSCEYDENVDFYDTQYPVESALVDIIKSEIIKDLLLKFKIPIDEINDGEDNINVEDTRKRRF